MQPRSLLAGGITAVLVLLASCSSGKSSSNHTAAFKASFDSDAGQLKRISQSIGSAIQKAPSEADAQLATTFSQLATRWQGALSQLETLKPPSNVAADFNTLTGAATRVETDLSAIASAAKTHSASAARQAGANLVTDIGAAKAASTSITTKLGST